MAVAPSKQPQELIGKREVGKEKRVQFAGEPAPRFHGALTSGLHTILYRADPSRESFDDLERALKEVFGHDVTVKVSDATRGQVVLANPIVTRANELTARLDEQRAPEIIAGLEEVVAKREEQGDYWPEGRLNLGIAYACQGEYEAARRWLDDAVNMLRYPSHFPGSEQMLA